MRRTFGLAVALCALVLAAGVTGVSMAGTRPSPRNVVQSPVSEAAKLPRIGAIESVTGALERRGRLVPTEKTLTYRYPGASYVKLHFSRATLRPGDRIVVADPTGTESYAYTAEDLAADPWAMSISGDTATVRLEQGSYDPLGLRTRLAGLGIGVDQVARGFRESVGGGAPEGPTQKRNREESICRGTDEKLDAVCYRSSHPVQYQKSKAVARLLINGVELCTAWRIGQGNRLLTNNHCTSSGSDVRRTEVWFNFECVQCNGSATRRVTKVYGDELIANDGTLDYALFSVQNFGAVSQYGHLEFDLGPHRTGDELYIPQHPRGQPTSIAMDDPGERSGVCAIDDPRYNGYDQATDVSYFCDTDGGSSGSPVISATTHKVVALHHFGGCPNSGVRVDLINREIAKLL
jgi:lysyl endopeptidase